MSKIFITSTLPYANSYRPHIGHLFEFILSDSITRFYKSIYGKDNVYFNTGLDQNGTKILQKANELKLPVEEFLLGVTKEWKKFCELFHINYDNFYETSSKEHSEKVTKIWNILLERGDIFEKEYTGQYCIGCESFKLKKDLLDDKCPDHPNVVLETHSETNYFFNLGEYKNTIQSWLTTNPIIPENRTTELLVFINDYDNIPISRKKKEDTFGIDVPNRTDQVIYVWFDALLNYIFAADKWVGWNNCNSIQLCGPDNLRFQAQVFQCFLAGLECKNTDKILIHGTILDNYGRKMSKTLGNVIDPIEQLDKYGLNPVRYYTLAGLNTTDNSNWDENVLVTQFNSEVCNDWGNLVSRVLHLVDTKIDKTYTDFGLIQNDFTKATNKHEEEIIKLWLSLKVKDALIKTNELVKIGNKYINDEKPWSNENFTDVLSNLYHLICTVGNLYKPVFPYIDIDSILSDKKKVILFDKLK
jgi:methionyl-tRNA synthetase